MLQVLLNVFVHGQDVQSAIENPRFASYSYPSSFAPYDYYPGRLNIEGRFPQEVGAAPQPRGHHLARSPPCPSPAPPARPTPRHPHPRAIAAAAHPPRPPPPPRPHPPPPHRHR